MSCSEKRVCTISATNHTGHDHDCWRFSSRESAEQSWRQFAATAGKRPEGGAGRIKIFLLLYNGSVVKVSASYIVLYASQTIEYCWRFRSRKITEPFEGRVEGIAAYLLVQYRETASSGFGWMCLSWYPSPQTIDGRVASALHRLDGRVACAYN